MHEIEGQNFRLRPWLKYAIGGGIYLWVLILMALLWQSERIPDLTYASVFFFIALFASVLVFYSGVTITADQYGVTYRGLVSFHTFPYESMLKVDVHTGFTGLVRYDVFTRAGLLQFSNFFGGHQTLLQMIGERAGLERNGRISHG